MTRDDEPRSRGWKPVLIGIAIVVVLLLACVVWVGVRTLMAKNELQAAVPLATRAQDDILAGDTAGAEKAISRLADHASAAASLTSDPIFAVSQAIPFAGPNLTAFRQVAVTIDDVASDGLFPLATLAGTLSASSLKPVDGSIQLQPLLDAAPALATAETVLKKATADLSEIDTTATIAPVTDAVNQLSSVVGDASSTVTTVSRTAQLMPAMLGATGDRNYLLMFQNNAEVRATGGLPGALAIVSTSNGHFELSAQSSANRFHHYDEPVLPIDPPTESLYSNIGRFMQNVNSTPDFPTTGSLAAEMWRRNYGLQVDGVLAVDPVMLSYLLGASGPVTLATGDVIDSSNAVDFLLSDVYSKYPDPEVQDLVFADAARAVFGVLSSGDLDPAALVSALQKGSAERRILIWNTRADEEKILADSDFAGTLPTTNAGGNVVGVYLNDATGAKMDYYLDAEATTSVGKCRADGKTTYRTAVELGSSAPADAATSLPEYVTSAGFYGVPAGSFRTRVVIYGPLGSTVVATEADGKPVEVQVEQHLGRSVAQFVVDLAPGARSTVSVDMLGTDAAASAPTIRMTPLVHPSVTKIKPLACGSTR